MEIPKQPQWFWFYNLRALLWARTTFGGGTYRTDGRAWFDYHHFPKGRANTPLSIAFAFVATHNHFVLDRGGKVFNRSAPIIKLPADATEDDCLALLGNMIALQEELDWRCYKLYGLTAQDLCYQDPAGNQCEPPALSLGQRAFEIVMTRQMATDELETTWFERHGSKPITELPDHWPEDCKRMVERRIELIEPDPYINLIERPEYKCRWNTEPWEDQERRALRNWLLDRLEDGRYWQEASLQTTRTLAHKSQMGSDFLQVAETYRGHVGFDVHALVAELVEAESVPFLPGLRYKVSGLRKREIWEHTWDLQRREDAIDAEVESTLTRRADETAESFKERLAAEQRRRKREEIGDIAPPPEYTSADFLTSPCWRLRGALDVPNERFVSYPFCSRDADPSLLIGWAGWDHLQQAKALAAWYTEVTEQEGWPVERLKPLLAGPVEIIPWLKQWHNDLEFQERMGDFFETFLGGQLQRYGVTRDDLKRWTPPASGRPRRGRRRSMQSAFSAPRVNTSSNWSKTNSGSRGWFLELHHWTLRPGRCSQRLSPASGAAASMPCLPISVCSAAAACWMSGAERSRTSSRT